MESLSLVQFLERVKNKQSVSRFQFSLSFKWDSNAVLALKKVLVDLSGANLSGANLSEANLSEANLSEANLSRANLSEIRMHVGCSFCLPCGQSWAGLVTTLKAEQKVKDYLFLQVISQLAWESKDKQPLEFVRDYLEVPKVKSKKVVLKKKKKGE